MHDGEKKDLTEGSHHRATTHVENLNGLNFQLSCNQRATDCFQVQSPASLPLYTPNGGKMMLNHIIQQSNPL